MSSIRWTQDQLDAYEAAKGRARGGIARANNLPPEVRCSIAKSGGEARAKIHAERKGPSQNEIRMSQQIVTAGLPEPVREYFHIAGRDFRLDFAWPDRKIGIEVQGGVHRIKGRFGADIEKRALGLLAGWRILELDSKSIRDERGIAWVKDLLAQH